MLLDAVILPVRPNGGRNLHSPHRLSEFQATIQADFDTRALAFREFTLSDEPYQSLLRGELPKE